MEKVVYKCKTCGAEFTGGRRLGDHYAENPDHRPATKPRADRPAGAAPVRGRKLSATDHIQAAIDKLAVEINAKRALLMDVDKIRVEITALENQRSALQKMLSAERQA